MALNVQTFQTTLYSDSANGDNKLNECLRHILDATKNIFSVNIILQDVELHNHKKLKIEIKDNYDDSDASSIIKLKDDELQNKAIDINNYDGEEQIQFNYSDSYPISSCVVIFKTDNSSENSIAAKDFIKTHLEPRIDYTTFSFQLESDELEKVLNQSVGIQKSTLVLIDCKQDINEITLFGPEKSVITARSKIVTILEIYRNQKRPFDNLNRESLFHEAISLSLNSFGDNGSQPFKVTSKIPNHSFGQTPEKKITDIQPWNSKYYQQALKLGYSESQIIKALQNVGPHSGWNELLGEVIKIAGTDSEKTSEKRQEVLDTVKPLLDTKLGDQLITDLSSCTLDHNQFLGDPPDVQDVNNLRHIIIDGSNVAMSHGKNIFSCKGIKLVVDWFRERGHKEITAFVPQWRKETSRPDAPITNQEILLELENEKVLVFTPSRRVKGRRVVCYDDRYILNLAKETDGIIVSNDMYRDLQNECKEFSKLVDQRLLMYSFVNDRFMPPEDPLGRSGPTLENFLRKTPVPKIKGSCPYGKKCTYGNKCRYYHPERGFVPLRPISDTLKEQAEIKFQEAARKQLRLATQPKQKLLRTKSLLPVDVDPPEDTRTQHEKPKLAHSKSVMLPIKSADYLNEPRKMLERAEVMAAQKTLSDNDLMGTHMTHSPADVPASEVAALKGSGFCALPISRKEAMKPPTDNTPSKTIKSSLHNTVLPKCDIPERYLSGHLLLAKKLSDEGSEQNFFSDHRSNPSSVHTSSSVLVLLNNEEKKDDGYLNVYEENIPNLSIFGSNVPLQKQKHHVRPWENNQTSPSVQNLSGHQCSDSGQFTSSESLTSPQLSSPQLQPCHQVNSHELFSAHPTYTMSQHPLSSADHGSQLNIPLDSYLFPAHQVCRQNSSSDPQANNNYAASQGFYHDRQQLDNQSHSHNYSNLYWHQLHHPHNAYSANQNMLGHQYLQPGLHDFYQISTNSLLAHNRTQVPQYNSHQQNCTNRSPVHSHPVHSAVKLLPPPSVSILPEEEPIVPDDPRYSIYYHLSSVFGEPLVRKVMNRSPHILNPDDVCSLILEYKQEKFL